MITSPKDYQSLLYLLQDPNRPTVIIPLPKDETIYDVDLNTRIINAPQFLSVEKDHRAEWIYFKMDRYYDNKDLSTTNCIFQYNNANPNVKKRGYIYSPPFIDTQTLKSENKIIVPWLIEGPATAYAGSIEFSIQFYQMDSDGKVTYSLNTLPCVSKILNGMDVFEETENYTYDENTVKDIYARINEIAAQNDIYWIKVE